MSDSIAVAAVDLGASSGRVMRAIVGPDVLTMTESGRFANVPVSVRGTLTWDILRLYRGVLEGLSAAGDIVGVGVDSWAIDYGLLDREGQLLGNPVCYRDSRTEGAAAEFYGCLPEKELYGITGLQYLSFTTIFQLWASQHSAQREAAAGLLLIPDLLGYWLTGQRVAELTNASTTGLVNVSARTYSPRVSATLGLPPAFLPPLAQPGDVVGHLTREVATSTGLRPATRVIAVGSHDTASAVVGVPATGPDHVYVSCGTWSLVGMELPEPVLSDDSRAANFTNELGVDGRVRYLRNVMGLWLLQECMRTWEAQGRRVDLGGVLEAAAGEPLLRCYIDAEDEEFLAPGSMPERIVSAVKRAGLPAPDTQAQVVRCIVDSLALSYRAAAVQAQELSGVAAHAMHIVGGGSRNQLLCQLAADATGLPVIAGPAEAAALGNALVQARALGALSGDLWELRALIRRTHELRHYQPTGDQDAWRRAQEHIEQQRRERAVRQ